MVAGSGSRLDSSSGGESGEPDGVHEAVPGPVTRLFVIANRGIANLIQDLILVSNLSLMVCYIYIYIRDIIDRSRIGTIFLLPVECRFNRSANEDK